jgi:hypothetical protein
MRLAALGSRLQELDIQLFGDLQFMLQLIWGWWMGRDQELRRKYDFSFFLLTLYSYLEQICWLDTWPVKS